MGGGGRRPLGSVRPESQGTPAVPLAQRTAPAEQGRDGSFD